MHHGTLPTAARTVLRFVAPSGLVVVAVVAFSASAQAESAAARNGRCVSRGADYVAVAGSENCVRLGGRVRVELGGPVSAYSGPTPDGSQTPYEPMHVRTDPISSFIQLFPR
jgi:hypothetical protein